MLVLPLLVLSLTISLVLIAASGGLGTASSDPVGPSAAEQPDVAPPKVDDPISDAELRDLQAVAKQFGITLEAAIDRYAWNDNFALAVAEIRKSFPEDFAGAEIVDANNAWIAFKNGTPEASAEMVDSFVDAYPRILVDVRSDMGFSEIELRSAIEVAHYTVIERSEVRDAVTSHDYATGVITTSVMLQDSVPVSMLNNLLAEVELNLASAVGVNILNDMIVSVVQSASPVLSGNHSRTEHLGGEDIICTTGFGVWGPGAVPGILTAGHCDLSGYWDDGCFLSLEDSYVSTYGDFAWFSGSSCTHTDDFYAGSSSTTETDRRDVSSMGWSVVGQSLCHNGRITHQQCQEVRKLNQCAAGACNLVQMGANLTEVGDSGGPVYWGNTAYGITKGWMHDPWPFDRGVWSQIFLSDDAIDVDLRFS